MIRAPKLSLRPDYAARPAAAIQATLGARLLTLLGVLAYGVGASQAVAQTAQPRIPQATLPVLRATTAGTFGGYTVNGANATLVQTSPAGIVNWSSFDIGSAAKLQIIQPSSTSTLLNRVEGGLLGNGRTTIDGSLTSNGQLYLINPSGIVFGNTARVDVGSLIASSLAIDDARYLSGLLSPGLAPNLAMDPASRLRPGDVIVEGSRTGGVLQQAALTAAKNGYILLAAPGVTNDGKLSAPDGQVVLAAGTRVYLAAPENTAMRGLRVEVGDQEIKTLAAGQLPVTATNGALGDIRVDRGNVTMAGLMVNQRGTVSATTSVNQNGSVWLLARTANKTSLLGEPQPVAGGALVLGTDSSITVQPTLEDATTSAVAATFNPSSVRLVGRQVSLENNAEIVAPGGAVTIEARAVPGGAAAESANDSRVEFGAGSRVDVSGSRIVLPMASNVVTVELRGTELADNLLLRDSPLRGTTVQVDARKGTAIANIAGWLALRENGVGEKTAAGGQISVVAEGSIVQTPASRLDVSGGRLTYAAGNVATTQLRAGDAVFDIGVAPSDRAYDGVIAATPGPGNYEASYVDGRDAGSVQLAAPVLVLQGTLAGGVTVGERQRLVGVASRTQGGELQIGATPAGAIAVGIAQDLLLGAAGVSAAAHGAASSNTGNSAAAPLALDLGALGRAGFSRITANTRGNASIVESLALPAGGALRLTASGLNADATESSAGSIQINGDVSIPAGSLVATARQGLTLAPRVAIDVAGRWVNDRATAQPARDANGALAADLAIRGGSIELSGNRLAVRDGATLNVSAGAWLDEAGRLTKGGAGALTLRATGLSSSLETEVDYASILGSGVALLGYGWSQGASLRLTGRDVYLGAPTDDARPTAYDLVLAAEFFSRGGFGSWSIAANGNLAVTADARITPLSASWVATQNAAQLPSGAMGQAAAPVLLDLVSPAGNRPAASITLAANSAQNDPAAMGGPVRFGSLSVAAGAAIAVDPGAAITLNAARRLTIDGTLEAPGGAIALGLTQGSPTSVDQTYDPLRAIRLGAQARLLATGSAARLVTDGAGISTGTLMDGGTVRIGLPVPGGVLPAVGYVVAASGSLIDVSGVDAGLRRFTAGSVTTADRPVASGAGSIEIRAREGLVLAGTLQGLAGGPVARGGSLTLALDRNGSLGGPGYPTNINDFSILSAPIAAAEVPPGGQSLGALAGQGRIALGSFAAGGFDRLNVRSDGTISLAQGASLRAGASIVLDSPVLRPAGGAASGSAPAPTTVAAPFVQLGNGDELTQGATPPVGGELAAGAPTLAVQATTLDLVGRSQIDGYATTRLAATEEIRLTGRVIQTPQVDAPDTVTVVGELTTAGDLSLRAPQTYPTTLTDFALRVGANVTGRGALIIEPVAGVPASVYSSGGRLSARAWSIDQGGRLSAPFGSIELIAGAQLRLRTGSVTSVAGEGQVLLGSVANGQDWSYDFAGVPGAPSLRFSNTPLGTGTTYERTLPAKSMLLQAPNVAVDTGAVVDLAGRGQIWSSEFVPGPLGSNDQLANSTTYAILPGYRLSVASADWESATANAATTLSSAGLRAGDAVWLSGLGSLAAGYYTLLPARYALLPGAYSISQSTAQASATRNLSSAANRVNLDGTMTLAGYRAGMVRADGSRATDAQWSGFTLASGDVVRRSGEFRLYDASAFFAAQSQSQSTATTATVAANTLPELPADAGHLTLAVQTALSLDGRFNLAGAEPGVAARQAQSIGASAALMPATGRGGLLDITAPRILITGEPVAPGAASGQATPSTATVVLAADRITAMNAASVAIGGVRSDSVATTALDVRAETVTISNDRHHPLAAAELIIAARDVVQVDGPASVSATASSARAPVALQVVGSGADADGAMLRLTSAVSAVGAGVARAAPSGLRGSLDIAPGAVMAAAGGLALDATADLKLHADLGLPDGASLSVAAPRISLGMVVPTGVDDVVFEGGALARLGRLAALDLHSYSTMDFYGSAQLGSGLVSRLSLQAAALAQRDVDSVAAPAAVTLTAGQVRLAGVTAALPGDFGLTTPLAAKATFSVQAGDSVELGAGALAIRGFASTVIAADQGVRAVGSDARLGVEGNLTIAAPSFSAGQGAGATVSASADLQLAGRSTGSSSSNAIGGVASVPTLGGRLSFAAAGLLKSDARITLPSGNITLSGGSGLEVTGGRLSVAGLATTFGSTVIGAPGGSLTLASTTGDIAVAAAAAVDVGAFAADGGQLLLSAPKGRLSLEGSFNGVAVAAASGDPVAQSRVAIDVGTVGDASQLGRLAARFGQTGFTDGFSLRARSGNLQLASNETLRAREVMIAVDHGNLRIDGSIDASGERAGEIGLYASERALPGAVGLSPGSTTLGRIEIGSSAQLSASAVASANPAAAAISGADGGRIVLGVGREDGATPSAIDGGSSILLERGAALVAAGSGEGRGGSLVLRAPRVGPSAATASDVAISMRDASIRGMAETVIEANQVYRLNDGATLTANPDAPNNLDVGAGGKMARDAASFVQSRGSILSRLGAGEGVVLRPGVEVRSTGSLTVSVNENAIDPADRGWNLNTWRMAGQPGTLTLRAAGDLNLLGSISDGYVRPATALAMPAWQLDPTSGASWSYRLVAGADSSAARPTAVLGFNSATSQAEQPRGADLRLRFARSISVDDEGEPQAFADLPVALVRTGTGRIELGASRDVLLASLLQASPTDPAADVRLGATVYTGGRAAPGPVGSSPPSYITDPAWGDPVLVQAGFGRDGGSIAIAAGRDVIGSAQPQLVTNALARQGGPGINTAWWLRTDQLRDGVATLGGGDLSIVANTGSIRDFSASVATSAWSTRDAQGRLSLNEFGGGRLQLNAAQDIAGGVYYVQKGVGEIRAGGSLTLGSPSIWDLFVGENGAYRAHSPVLALGAGRWDVVAGNALRLEAIYNPTITPLPSSNGASANAYLTYSADSAVRLRALGGDVTLSNDDQLLEQASSGIANGTAPGVDPKRWFRLTPGRLTAAALGGDVNVLQGFAMAPAAAMQLNLLAKGSVSLRNGVSEPYGIVQIDAAPAKLPSATATRPFALADYDLLRGTTEGLLGHNSLGLQVGVTEPMRIVALGGDISGDNYGAATLTLTRRAEILAGRDIRDLGFRIQQGNADDVTQIRAGRDLVDSTISMGFGSPVAHVVTGPGRIEISAGRNVDFGNGSGLVTRGNLDNPFLPEQGASIQISAGVATAPAGSGAFDGSDPAALLVRLRTTGITAAELAELRPQLNEAFFKSLVAAAKVSGLSDFDGLIATLFPATSAATTNVSAPTVSGNINLTGSQVKTEQGGSIDLFAPTGSINVALVRVPSFIAIKKPAELGVFTIRGGAIRALVRDDFLVNSGRVFSLRGGDISLISQFGNIDAGRGAKTAASAPPPLLTTDQNGNTRIDISGSIAGSGIATLKTQSDQAPSNIYPVAPRGIFDAGDAGVRSTGTVQVTAQTVLNAGNISASGGVSGAPVVAAPSLGAVAIPASTTASGEGVGKSASTEQRLLSLDVEVLCFGEGEQAVEAGSAKGAANESCKRQTKSPAPVSEVSPIINSQSQL